MSYALVLIKRKVLHWNDCGNVIAHDLFISRTHHTLDTSFAYENNVALPLLISVVKYLSLSNNRMGAKRLALEAFKARSKVWD